MGSTVDKITYLNQTKTNIKNAIINKGGNVSNSDTFRSYANKISSLPEGPNGISTVICGSNNSISIGDMVYVANGIAYKIDNNSLNIDNTTTLGYALDNISSSASGKVKLLSYTEPPNQSYAGTLTFSGRYTTSSYLDLAGCRLYSDIKQGKLFLSLKLSSSGGYTGITFGLSYPLLPPSGVSMLTPPSMFNKSSFTGNPGCTFCCAFSGVTTKLNIEVLIDSIEPSIRMLIAELKFTNA